MPACAEGASIPKLLRKSSAFPAIGRALAAGQSALDGRMILILSTDDGSEPRFQVNAGMQAPAVFGVDVNGFTEESVDRAVSVAVEQLLRTLER